MVHATEDQPRPSHRGLVLQLFPFGTETQPKLHPALDCPIAFNRRWTRRESVLKTCDTRDTMVSIPPNVQRRTLGVYMTCAQHHESSKSTMATPPPNHPSQSHHLIMRIPAISILAFTAPSNHKMVCARAGGKVLCRSYTRKVIISRIPKLKMIQYAPHQIRTKPRLDHPLV